MGSVGGGSYKLVFFEKLSFFFSFLFGGGGWGTGNPRYRIVFPFSFFFAGRAVLRSN
jgi:hypothetical protein